MAEPLRIRKSIQSLQEDYQSGRDRKPLEDLIRAWRYIQALPAEHPQSFFTLGGFHGEPFRGAGWGNSQYWGGYCNHGNVLFPTWHRVYLLKLEEALRSAPGCGDVTLPFWDETAPDSLAGGIPEILTQPKFTLDGAEIDNPLQSFTFTQGTSDFISTDNNVYSKPKGYKTVRYPLSGLVGTKEDREASEAHNKKYESDATKLLNQNVVNWLTSQVVVNGQPVSTQNVRWKFERCLEAPNYTVFSNTSSAEQWNFDRGSEPGERTVVPLEDPHNDIHLAVGGFDLPPAPSWLPPNPDFSPIDFANGDMGENNTAGLDPIFFFHHCFIDRVFWLWQKRHSVKNPYWHGPEVPATDALDIIPGYPGTNTVDSQGPTPGMAPNTWLTLDTPLNPFHLTDGRPFTSRDCINIETQLGYTYGPGSLEVPAEPVAKVASESPRARSAKKVQITGVNRGTIRGSFLISIFATIDGKPHRIATKSVLSRWNVQGCANCQTHLDAKTSVDLGQFDADVVDRATIDVEVHTHDRRIRATPKSAPQGVVAAVSPLRVIQEREVQFEVQ